MRGKTIEVKKFLTFAARHTVLRNLLYRDWSVTHTLIDSPCCRRWTGFIVLFYLRNVQHLG